MNSKDPVCYHDGSEREAAAEQAYIEWEMYTRGDGCWMPWADVGDSKRGKWLRIADAVLRGINHHRYSLGERGVNDGRQA